MLEKNKKPEIRFVGFNDDWEQRKFSETFIYLKNNSLSRADLNYEQGLVKNVHYGDVLIKFGEILDVEKAEIPFISNNEFNVSSASLLKNGDVVIADAAEDETVGKCSEIKGIDGISIVSGLHTIPCRSSMTFATGYLGYYMNSSAYHDQLLPLIQGAKISSISKAALQNTDIIYPDSEKEQLQIGQFFQNLDTLITLDKRKLDKLKTLRKSMLEKMFTLGNSKVPEIRFNGFTDDWEQRKAKDLFESTADKGHPELPVLSATQDRGMIKRDENGINIFHDKKNEEGYKRVLPGQFVIHLRSFQGGFAHSSIEGITSPAYTVFGFKEQAKHCDIFWKYIFNSKEFIRRLETVTYGIRDGRSISYDEFLTMSFTYPNKTEQTKIAQYLTGLDNFITLHQRKLEKLQNIKLACMEKMFV